MDGLVRVEHNVLVLEYQVKDGFLGVIKSGPKELRVPSDQISHMWLEEGLFGTALRIQAASLKTWASFPETEKGEVKLSLRRADRPAARELVNLLCPQKASLPDDFA